MLGYGNLSALAGDPRVNPRAWEDGNDIDAAEAAARANSVVSCLADRYRYNPPRHSRVLVLLLSHAPVRVLVGHCSSSKCMVHGSCAPSSSQCRSRICVNPAQHPRYALQVVPLYVRGVLVPVLVVSRDIAPGEEVTVDRGQAWWRQPHWQDNWEVRCGHPSAWLGLSPSCNNKERAAQQPTQAGSAHSSIYCAVPVGAYLLFCPLVSLVGCIGASSACR